MKKILFFIICFFIGLFKRSKIVGRQLCNATTNQFSQTNSVGTLDLTTNPNPSVMTVLYNPGSSNNIIPGEGVKLVDLGVSDAIGPPIVDQRALDSDAVEGIVLMDQKKATKEPGDLVSIARRGAVIFQEASAAIARGAAVALVLASPGQVVTRTTEILYGKALDKASAAGDLIRVEVLQRGVE